jgi:hypothetical protein
MNEAGLFVDQLLRSVVDVDEGQRSDEWMKSEGGAFLRRLLSAALTLRGERKFRDAPCSCGGRSEFKQHRPFEIHTVLPGRDVSLLVPYALCAGCKKSAMPLLVDLKTDAEGFTPALRELGLLAAVKEPYEEAAEMTLPKFAGVEVSRDKLHSLVQEYAPAAVETMRQPAPQAAPPAPAGPIYVGIDGGMAFVDKAWQEIKLGVLFEGSDFARNDDSDRGAITARRVVGVRGNPNQLEELLVPHAHALADREVVVLGDGAPWIWNLADRVFPNRTEILDWYHVDEHVSLAARTLFGEGTDEAARWRALQLEYLMHDQVAHVLSDLQFLLRGRRAKAARKAASDLHDYLDANRTRVRYGTFKARGLRIGSGFIESAVNHVMQHRMKRPGMRWHAPGADAILPLRCVLRTTGAWPNMLSKFASTGTG